MPLASYVRYLAGFNAAAVGLAPLCPETLFSRGKSVKKALAYLDRRVSVIGSDAGEHGRVFRASGRSMSRGFSRMRRRVK